MSAKQLSWTVAQVGNLAQVDYGEQHWVELGGENIDTGCFFFHWASLVLPKKLKYMGWASPKITIL